jgi:hypothetical protein
MEIIKNVSTPLLRQLSIVVVLVIGMVFGSSKANAQEQEIEQLLLNIEKLTQFKSILSDMKEGYSILSSGYSAVKNISQGNFSLHEAFIDGLLLVNPEIKKYKRVADIILCQKSIVSEYKSAFNRFKASGNFNPSEVDYLGKVYKQLLEQSMANVDELTNVITDSKMRMSDDERLQAIDRIYADTQDKLQFLRNFNKETSIMNLQRQKQKADVSGAKRLYNLN